MSWSMWPPKRPDLGAFDLAFAARACLVGPDAEEVEDRLEARWAPGRTLATLSVRSAFDLFLAAADLRPGDEILFSGLTVGDMPRIARHHGLVPIPVDVELETVTPALPTLEAALTPRARVLVLANLFGGRGPVEALIRRAREEGLLVVEDDAQAFDGGEWRGHPGVDVSLVSFGSIKTATALGAGLARVDRPELLEAMRTRQEAWPRQSAAAFLQRVLRYAVITGGALPAAYGGIVRAVRAVGADHEAVLHETTRGFPDADLLQGIRRRPSAPLLALLERRLRRGSRRLDRRRALGQAMVERLGEEVSVPGRRQEAHQHWLTPVLSRDPDGLIDALRRLGYDATRGRSLVAVQGGTPPDPDRVGEVARRIVGQVVFLPVDGAMSEEDIRRMADAVLGFEEAGRAAR